MDSAQACHHSASHPSCSRQSRKPSRLCLRGQEPCRHGLHLLCALAKDFLLENLGEILDSQKAAPLLRMLMSSESSSVMKDKFEQKAVLSQGLFSRGMELLLGDKQHSSFSGWICGPPVMRSRQKRCDQLTLSLIIILSVSNWLNWCFHARHTEANAMQSGRQMLLQLQLRCRSKTKRRWQTAVVKYHQFP